MNAFIDTMNNTTYTENGALTNKSTYNACLDWFFHGSALRGQSEDRIIDLFSKAFDEDPNKALKTLFYIRDCRGGQGERDIFRKCLVWLANKDQEKAYWLKNNLDLINEYGRWDDYLCLLNTNLADKVSNYLIMQLLDDKSNLEKGNASISQCAKWMPSLNSSKDQRKLAKLFIKLVKKNYIIDFNEEKYRKTLSQLRKAIKIVEHNLTEKNYEDIDYSKLPSYAGLKYRHAFNVHDTIRYKCFLEEVKAGKANINSKVLYPYDLVRSYNKTWNPEVDETIEAQWKALPDYIPEINGIVVNDTSGSMSGLPMEVSVSLAIYIAERNKSEVWKNYVIPFSSHAEWKEVKGNTLLEKMRSVHTGDCSNTNLQFVFDLILGRAINNHVPKEDMPKVLLIITDMEFDQPYENNWSKTNFEVIKEKYAKAGYEMPNLVWWNVSSRNTQTPITKDNKGNILLSGCSASMLSVALSGEFDPVEAMNRIINQERYNKVSWLLEI